MSKATARIYACGGAGVNIGKLLLEFNRAEEPGAATIDVAFIDTSSSNIDNNINPESMYIFENIDGSGSIRSENYKAISENTLKILKKFEPKDINIVVSSTGGGSGSVIAPSIVSQLLEDDQQVVVIQIGDSDSKIRINNSIRCIKSYEAISQKRGKPVVISYFENSTTNTRSSVDNSVRNVIIALSVVFSRQNSELDSRDLYNFLNFHKVTSNTPQIAELSVLSQTTLKDFEESAVTVATVAENESQANLEITPEYRCVGYLPASVNKEIASSLPIHLVVTIGGFYDQIKAMEERVVQIEKDQKARRPQARIISENDDPTESGIIL